MYLFLRLISTRVFLSLLIALINPLNFPLSSSKPSYFLHLNHRERRHSQRVCAQDTFTDRSCEANTGIRVPQLEVLSWPH